MSMNLVAETFDSSRDFGIYDSDTADVAEIEAVFQADWERAPVNLSDQMLVWSPENSRSRMLTLINSATSTLDVYAEELTDRDTLSALNSASSAGVRVRLLMTDTGSHDPARPGRAMLEAAGAQVRLQSKPFVHAKIIIADGAAAFAGSENLTAASLDDNRELGLLTFDSATIGVLSQTFAEDWSQASPAPSP
jgi:cardiolipin synthase A/B